MPKELILTLDAGTTGCKCTVFDARGTALASARKDYKTSYPRPNWAEQDMAEITSAICDGTRELLSQVKASDIACVGLSGTSNGLLAVGEGGQVLHPFILHSDARSQTELPDVERVIPHEAFYQMTGNRLDFHFTLTKILWLRRNRPDIYRRTRCFLAAKDYIYGFLTGNYQVTDYSDASLTTMLDIHKRRWALELLKELGIDAGKLPEIRQGQDVSGAVTDRAALLTGLLPGTRVAVGGGDGACAGRGAGLHAPGAGYCCLGSSAWVSQLTEAPLLDPKMRIFNFLDMDGQVNHTLGVIQTGAAAYDWAVDNLFSGAGSGEVHGRADYYRIESMARAIEPGAEGVLFLNTLMGERTPHWDPSTKGCLIGFSLYHDQRHVARAVYEGVAMSLNQVAMIMRELGRPLGSLMLTGGGARSGLWPDIFASVFDMPIDVHMTPGEGTALGAMMAAGVGVGLFDSFAQAATVVRSRSTHEPNPAWVARYRRVFDVYQGIYGCVKPIFDGIEALG